ncbi:Aste57867_10701 [Aphanomyces stellatus]|uniref:Aste57867_10701 protein n=1 Tax=Aphanomyces stellatus TaxID=120398 RepID=A0A485KR54_9STRA|nr:hypothetical protein As57867_010661 [Aphanomyces stellatus]VFT87571.1 Aste57867_10701 [Aphanomyces stellatus]
MLGIPCSECTHVNPPIYAKCFACATPLPDDKTKVQLLYDELRVMQARFAQMDDVASTCTATQEEQLRNKLALEAEWEEVERAKASLVQEKELQMLLLDEQEHALRTAQAAWKAKQATLDQGISSMSKQDSDEETLTPEQDLKSTKGAEAREEGVGDCQKSVMNTHDEVNNTHHPAASGKRKRDSTDIVNMTTINNPVEDSPPQGRLDRPSKKDGTRHTTLGSPGDHARCVIATQNTAQNQGRHVDVAEVGVRTLWKCWFLGDKTMKPLRCLHVPGRNVPHMYESGIVVQKLVYISVAHAMVSAPDALTLMAEPTLMAIFDRAFDILLHHNPEGNLVDNMNDENTARSALIASTLVQMMYKARQSLEIPRRESKLDLILAVSRALARLVSRQCQHWFTPPATHLEQCQKLMDHLVQVAIDAKFVLSKCVLMQLPTVQLMEVFDQAFAQRDGSTDINYGFMTCAQAIELLQSRTLLPGQKKTAAT